MAALAVVQRTITESNGIKPVHFVHLNFNRSQHCGSTKCQSNSPANNYHGFPDRPQDGHKGTFGRVLIIGGSVGMSGAVCLSSVSALRSGSGLVTAAIPRSIQMTVAGWEPCVMTIGLETDSHGQLAALSRERIEELLAGKDVVAIGPGLGQSAEAAKLVSLVLDFCRVPLVLDADALNAVARGGLLAKRNRESACVITPHPGEFARLTGLPVTNDEDTRIAMSADFARTARADCGSQGAPHGGHRWCASVRECDRKFRNGDRGQR